jgi:hypothetical protein
MPVARIMAGSSAAGFQLPTSNLLRQPLAWQLTRSVTVPTRGTGGGR